MTIGNNKGLEKRSHLTRRLYKRKDKSLAIQKSMTEYEVKEENNKDNCPSENLKNESCINPECDFSGKCNSYSINEKWVVLPLK